MNEPINYTQLIANLKAGGSRRKVAIVDFYPEVRSNLLRYFVRRGLDLQTADDLFQGTVEIILKKIGGFRGDSRSQLWAWIWAIAKNEMSKYWKEKAKRRQDPWAPEDINTLQEGQDNGARPHNEPLESVERSEFNDCLNAAFQCFALRFPAYAEALYLHVLNGWKHAELAHHLGRNERAMREYMSQVRKRANQFRDTCHELFDGVTA